MYMYKITIWEKVAILHQENLHPSFLLITLLAFHLSFINEI